MTSFGIEPLILLWDKLSDFKYSNLSNVDGIVPWILLCDKSIIDNHVGL